MMSKRARITALDGFVDGRSLYTSRCIVHASRSVRLGSCHGHFTVLSSRESGRKGVCVSWGSFFSSACF